MRSTLLSAALVAGLVTAGAAQQRSYTPLDVGTDAPLFTLKGATKSGLLPNQVNLLDFRGQTVVLAFFFKARTGG